MEKDIIDISYYDRFSKFYDLASPRSYYHKPRKYAIKLMDIKKGNNILNIPCGTGQSISYIHKNLKNSGTIIGIDLSEGMLQKARQKSNNRKWKNVILYSGDARDVNQLWINKRLGHEVKFDSIICDLGLSGFQDWKSIIDNLLTMLKADGRLVIMDWYMEKLSLRGKFIKWIGKGEVQRPIWQYLESQCTDFHVKNTFKHGEMFVASGKKKL